MFRLSALLLLALALIVVACQESRPATDPQESVAQTLGARGTPAPLGVFRLTGPADGTTLQLHSENRSGQALADTFDVDLTDIAGQFFRLTGFSLVGPTTLRVNFSFQHPLPIPATRTDLAVFDLRLHLLSPTVGTTLSGPAGIQSHTGPLGSLEDVALAGLRVINADGWSSWGDEVVEPAVGELAPNLYPYRLFHEDTGTGTFDPVAPAGWNVIPMASTLYTLSLDLELTPGSPVDVFLALEASYGASAMGPALTPVNDPGGRLNPLYFVPEFSLKEAWKSQVTIMGTPTIGDAGSSASMVFRVFDHQGPLPAVGNFDPLIAPQNTLRFASSLKEAQYCIPGILPGAPIIPVSNFLGTGTSADPYRITIPLSGDQLQGTAGTYTGYVVFRDAMLDSAGMVSPLATLGYSRDAAPVTRYDFATYQTFTLTVLESTNLPPVAVIAANPTTVPHGGTTDLSPDVGTMDPDGTLTQFEYDFSYNGVVFNIEASNATGEPVTSPALNGPATITMAMRVKDDGTPSLSDIDQINITVEDPPPPTWTQIHSMITMGDPTVLGDAPCVSCHIDGPNGLFMTFDKQETYENLVGVLSTCGLDYIVPNDETISLLYRKISEPEPPCGLRMPRSGPPYWSPEAIEMVRQWILDGAQNN